MPAFVAVVRISAHPHFPAVSCFGSRSARATALYWDEYLEPLRRQHIEETISHQGIVFALDFCWVRSGVRASFLELYAKSANLSIVQGAPFIMTIRGFFFYCPS